MPSLKWALGVAIALMATLSPALAQVVDIRPAGPAVDVGFVTPPDDGAVYFSGPSVPLSDSILGKIFGWTGLQIWFVFLRDDYLTESTDYLDRDLTMSQLSHSLYLINLSKAVRIKESCRNLSPSAQAKCEMERDLLSAGWTNPEWHSDLSSGFYLQGLGSDIVPFTTWYGTLVSEFLRDASQSLTPVDLPNGAQCCDAFVMNNKVDTLATNDSLSLPESISGVTTPSLGESPVVIPEIDQNSSPIPEPSIPLMLLIGATGLAYVARKRAFSKVTPQILRSLADRRSG